MINWDNFHFIRPEALLAIIPLLVLVWFIKNNDSKRTGWQGILSAHLYQHLITQNAKSSSKPPFWLLALSWVIACFALAGPTWQKLPQPVYQLNTGNVLVLDMSMSMRATDLTPDRLSRTKFKAIDLLNQINEGEIGLVVYAGDAFVVSPLTTDIANLTTLIPSISPEIMPQRGSDPYTALVEASTLLMNAGYTKGQIYWFTDGIDFSQVDELNEYMKESNYQFSILGIGSEEGAPIRMINGDLLKDASGNIVIPRLNSGLLSQALGGTGGRYIPVQSDNSDIERLIIDRSFSGEGDVDGKSDNVGDKWQDMGAFILLLILPFAAYAFRRGVLTIVLVGLFILPSPTVSATTLEDIFKNDAQKGLDAYQQSEFEKAAEYFEDPLKKGAALYKNKQYDDALSAFEQAGNSIEATYNLANTHAQLGNLERAIDAYEQVLNADPQNNAAAKNKAIVEKMLEQQQEKQKDDENNQSSEQDKQDQENQDSDNSQQNSDENDDNESDKSDSQPSKDSSEPSPSDQEQPENEDNNEDQQPQQESNDESSEQDKAEKERQQKEAEEQQAMNEGDISEKELTPEEREEMQRLQQLLRKVPDDPAYLLQRKMLLESKQRQRSRAPDNKGNW